MKSRRSSDTAFWVGLVITCVINLALLIGAVVVMWHFIAKWW